MKIFQLLSLSMSSFRREKVSGSEIRRRIKSIKGSVPHREYEASFLGVIQYEDQYFASHMLHFVLFIGGRRARPL